MRRGIISSREAIIEGACFRVGDGSSINPWKDPWIPWIQGHVPILKEGINGNQWRSVSSLRTHDGLNWNAELIREI